MAKRSVRATEHKCDVCGATFLRLSGEELPMGMYLTIYHVGGGASPRTDAYVCDGCQRTPLDVVATSVYEREWALTHPGADELA